MCPWVGAGRRAAPGGICRGSARRCISGSGICGRNAWRHHPWRNRTGPHGLRGAELRGAELPYSDGRAAELRLKWRRRKRTWHAMLTIVLHVWGAGGVLEGGMSPEQKAATALE